MNPKTALLAIDIQEGFCNAHTEGIPARVNHILQHGNHSHRLLTQFINSEDSAFNQILKWDSVQDEPEINLRVGTGIVFTKTSYSALANVSLLSFLKDNQITEVHLCGMDTDACILATAFALFDAGLKPVILADCCASSAGILYHQNALKIMRRNIGPEQIVEDSGSFLNIPLFNGSTAED